MEKTRKTLSVAIIAGNEEKNIGDCLESVKWADEIIVVDSESKDKTVEIARRYTDKVFIRKWEGYAPQKQFAIEQASCDWILSLDADERVSPELREEIEKILENETEYDGFYIPRRNFFLGKWIKSCGWYPNYQLRLFKRGKARVTQRKVHEGFVVDGKVGYLKGDIIHFTHPTLKETLAKINEYSSLSAEEKAHRKKVKSYDLILHPLAAFLSHYIIKRGFKDGVYGLMVSLIHAMTNMQTYMKIWEIQNVGKDEEKFGK
ncbi:glycosyltransferase family 2 protein [Candidatus Chrysopegis kryptomonas]|jgi:glycosyltransferase involved in cell wall biosynthesis|uniref:Glycosyltransferase involved in cell wall bisynthesis n=1 Tax=Candidatus Chryseopegocella kryptomonas TaxID=1633643 RepID=A0A0P1NZI1_9BACT|nr:glycosyltransferase family 2 protein [Candidatus Chrysopegis kryptomonas]CUT04494.1 Glycosyltransferase involved in cell wall bisynthesis [Candidatus Chrysopegis kryptomonas]